MNAEFSYTALAALLNAVEEIEQNFSDGELTAEMVAHLVECANRPEIREIARQARRAAESEAARSQGVVSWEP